MRSTSVENYWSALTVHKAVICEILVFSEVVNSVKWLCSYYPEVVISKGFL